MGVGSSKNRNESVVISSNKRNFAKTPPLRGTSRSPPEAWDTRSEPDTIKSFREDDDSLNLTNTSYNLLDLQPYNYYDANSVPSPAVRKIRSPSSPIPMKNKRSPFKTWQSPSPERKKKSPSPTKKRNNDKYKDFRNLTQDRDRKLRNLSPDKGLPYQQTKRYKSPEKKLKSSPKKKLNADELNSLTSSAGSSTKNLPSLRVKSLNSSLSTSLGSTKEKSPYGQRDPSPTKKKSFKKSPTKLQRRQRNNSLPELEVPKKQKEFKKPTAASSKSGGHERRLSDVSTIGLEEKPVFRPIRNQALKPKSGESFGAASPYGSRPKPKSLKKLVSSPHPPPPPKSTSGGANKKGPMSRGTSHGSIGSELGFTNIAAVKSATNSVQSTRSNFDINAKIDRFNDKKQTLALMDLGKHTVLNNSFRDAKMPGGPQPTYEQAKKDLQKEEWEEKISGIEKIVTIVRKAPEVLRNDLKTVVQLLLEELKNLRSQVCRSAALAWAELFFALGKALEPYVENVAIVLLQKSADTNKFLREGCLEALMSMVENISVNKAILTIVEGGLSHKSVVVRTHVAMLIDHVITAIGPERFYGSSKDTQICVITNGTRMLSDGALDVRTHIKHTFGVLSRHANFEPLLKEIVPERDLRTIQKTLDAIMNGSM